MRAYSRHRLTALVVYVTTLTYKSTNDQRADLACPLVSSSKTKPCQFSSVRLRELTSLCTRLNKRPTDTVLRWHWHRLSAATSGGTFNTRWPRAFIPPKPASWSFERNIAIEHFAAEVITTPATRSWSRCHFKTWLSRKIVIIRSSNHHHSVWRFKLNCFPYGLTHWISFKSTVIDWMIGRGLSSKSLGLLKIIFKNKKQCEMSDLK